MRHVLRCALLLAALCSFGVVRAGEALIPFDDNFFEDPNTSGDWVFNGVATWVPAPGDAFQCVDPNVFDPVDPCSVYNEDDIDGLGLTAEEFGGYILATPPETNLGGNAFRATPALYDNFKMEVVVELRDGTIARPADGMVITVVGEDPNNPGPPNNVGTGGGGMGAPCVGRSPDVPQLAWEFDNWSCNTGDDNNDNHLAFSYSPIGFPCTDAIQPDVKVEIDPAIADFHNQLAPPAPPNRYRMTVFAQNCGGVLTVATDLEALDFNGGADLGRVFVHTVEDFEPFSGYLGVTASTGGAWQNHILHSATLEELPKGFCLQPAAQGRRSISGGRDPIEECGDYQPGDELTVNITLENVRTANECCPEAGGVIITDTPPAGWAITGVNGGTDNGDGTVSWTLAAGEVSEGASVSYTIMAPDPADPSYSFGAGSVVEDTEGAPPTVIGGTTITNSDCFDACGGIKGWNIAGAIDQPGVNGSLDGVRQDYLTDGVVGETEFVFEPGATISPDFFGASAGTGIRDDDGPGGHNPNSDIGELEVFVHNATTGFLDHNVLFGSNGDPNNIMTYQQVYVHSDAARSVFLGISSDDEMQAYLNEVEVAIHEIARAGQADACLPQGTFPVDLVEGENRLLLKIFEDAGGWNATVRFEDELGNPVIDGLTIVKTPVPGCRVPPLVANREIDTGQTSAGNASWSEEGTVAEVNLAISDIRAADGGDCADAGETTITETVPVDWLITEASGGGVIAGDGQSVSWTLGGGGAGGFPANLSYSAEAGGAFSNVTISGSIVETGSDFQFSVKGSSTIIFTPPLFEVGEATVIIEDDFDEHTGDFECPDGWTCNTNAAGDCDFSPLGTVPYDGPGVTQEAGHEGRLQLTGECLNIGSTVIWNESINLEEVSMTAEFDVFMSSTGASPDPADGATFMLLNADDPLTQFPTALGTAGGGIGYSGLTGLAVEFDTWSNNAQDPSGYNTNDYTHVGVIRDGAVTPHVQTHLDLNPNAFPLFLGGDGWPEWIDFAGTGVPIHVLVTYNNGNIQVEVEAPETAGGLEPAFGPTVVLDTVATFPALPNSVLQNVLVGFSGGTGGATHFTEIDNVVVTTYEQGQVGTPFVRGDINTDGGINIADPVFLLNNLFGGGPPSTCAESTDVNDDGGVNIADPVFLLNRLFGGGPPVPEPNPDCGLDPNLPGLGCDQSACP